MRTLVGLLALFGLNAACAGPAPQWQMAASERGVWLLRVPASGETPRLSFCETPSEGEEPECRAVAKPKAAAKGPQGLQPLGEDEEDPFDGAFDGY